MDNFRKTPKSTTGRSRNVDGILNHRSQPKPHTNETTRKHQSNLPTPSAPLGNFGRGNGFHSTETGKLGFSQAAAVASPTAVGEITALHLDMPPASVDKKRRKRSWRKRLLWSFLIIVIAVAAIGGFLFAKGYLNLRHVLKGGSSGAPALQQNVDPTKLKGEGDGRVNILLLGRGGTGHDGPDLTDTILVASIDPVQKTAAILSIPRDFYVKNSNGHPVKINQIYADAKYSVLNGKKTSDQAAQAEAAGFKAIETQITNTMGIPIHYHVIVDFKAYRDAVNTVGGIDLNVTTPLYEVQWLEDIHKNYVLNVQPGMQHFDGIRALAYARSRHTSPRGDFDRTERQRAMLVALKSRVFSLGTYSNPIRISQLIDAFGNHVDTNMNSNEMMRLYTIGKDIDGSKVVSIGLADPPNDFVKTANINGLSVVIPKAGLYEYSEIRNYVRNTLKDSYLLSENASITILNGTSTPGLATKKATELKSYGYNVVTVGDAPTKTYDKTVLVDLTKGTKKYTKHYLEQRLGVTAVSQLPSSAISPGSANFVIILGSNESTAN